MVAIDPRTHLLCFVFLLLFSPIFFVCFPHMFPHSCGYAIVPDDIFHLVWVLSARNVYVIIPRVAPGGCWLHLLLDLQRPYWWQRGAVFFYESIEIMAFVIQPYFDCALSLLSIKLMLKTLCLEDTFFCIPHKPCYCCKWFVIVLFIRQRFETLILILAALKIKSQPMRNASRLMYVVVGLVEIRFTKKFNKSFSYFFGYPHY